MRKAIILPRSLLICSTFLGDDSSPLINESLRLHLPLSAPTDALRRRLQNLTEPDRVTTIIKRYVQFHVTGDGWNGIVELSRILAISVSPCVLRGGARHGTDFFAAIQ